MPTVTLQFPTDDKDHRKAVVLPLDERERIVEELDDIRACDAAKADYADRNDCGEKAEEAQERRRQAPP